MIFLPKKKYLLLCLVFLALCFTGCDNIRRAKIAGVDYPRPNSRRLVLDNGMAVLLTENHKTPFVAIEVLVKAGSSLEQEFSSSGISHFVEHMLFKGTKKRGVGKIEDEIGSYGAQINAFTSFDYTGYTISTPKEHLEQVLELLSDVLANPTFIEKELEKERQVILKEIDMNYDEPQRRLSQLFYKAFYTTHTYRYPIIGERRFLNTLTREDLLKFYKRNYVANNMILAISGDIVLDDTVSLVKSTFGSLKGAPINPISIPSEPRQLSNRYIEENYEGNLTYLMLGFHSISLLDDDLFALDLLSTILGGTRSSRLFRVLYEKRGLVYNVTSYNYTPRFPGVFAISTIIKEKKQKETLEAIFDEIERLKRSGVLEEELTLAKNNVVASFISGLETIQAQASDFASSEALTGDFEFSRRYIERIKKITPREIMNVARKYLNRDTSTVVILKPSTEEQKADKTMPLKSEEEVKKITLKNGLPIIYSIRKDCPKISITIAFKGGLLGETESTNGISNITANMLLKGAASKDSQMIQKIIEGLGGSIEAFSGNSSFGFKIEMLNKNIRDGIDLAFELIEKSTFPDKELQKEKLLTKAKILERDEDVYSHTILVLRQLLFKDHPYELDLLGTNESIDSLTKKDVINFHKNYVAADNMVISISGDFEEKAVLQLIEKKFSLIKQRGISLPEKMLSPLSGFLFKSQNLPKKEAVIMLGFRAASLIDNDRFSFEILESVLSGENGRIFHQIRQKRALSYSQGAFYVPAFGGGYFVIYASVNPDKVDLTKALIIKEIEKLKSQGITGQELFSARNKLLSKHWLGLQTNSGLSFKTALDELYGLGYDSFKTYNTRLDSVRLEDVKGAVNKYFDLKSCAISVTLPSE